MKDSQVNPAVSKKLTDWENEPNILVLKNDFSSAQESQGSIIAKIDKWIDLRDCTGSAKPRISKNGRSRVQPKLVRRQAEWRYPALSEPFLSTHKLFKVYPRTFEDAEAAKQNELILNWQFNTKLNKVKFIDDLIRANVDEGTAIIRVGWDRVTKPKLESVPVFQYFPIQDRASMQALQEALQLSETNPREYNETVSEELKASVDYFKETQIPTIAQIVGMQEVQTEDIVINQPTVQVINPRNFYIDPSCNGDFDKALFAIVSFETCKADLLKEGDRYKNLEYVDWQGASVENEPDHFTISKDLHDSSDIVRKQIVAYEYWGFYDIHGNGELVPFVATWIGNTIIRMELNPFPDQKLPFVIIPYLPVKREIFGESDAELLEDNQRILGAITRSLIDSFGRSANAQIGFAKGALDRTNKMRFDNGEDFEFNPNFPPNAAIIQQQLPELPQSAFLMAQVQNQEAEAITGVKSFSGGLAGDSYGRVATGIQGVLDAAAKREMAILRRLAKGVTDLGNKIIAMNYVFLSEEEVVRVTNTKFVTIKREDLKGNFDLEVDIATSEIDNIKAQDLGFLLQTMGPNMDPIASMQILGEIAELKRMPKLANYFRNWKPQPDPIAEELKRIELEKAKIELAKLQSEIQYNQARSTKTLAEAEATGVDTAMEVDGTKHYRDMEKQQAQAMGNQKLEVTKALLKPTKEGESNPDIEAAVGYNTISDRL